VEESSSMETVIQRIGDANARMQLHNVDMNEPLIINESEIDYVAEFIYSSLRKGQPCQLQYLKQSLKAGKCILFGRKIHVLP
jgi:hypothetical protein